MQSEPTVTNHFRDYVARLHLVLDVTDWSGLEQLAGDIRLCWQEGRRVFLCGNGGSAGNAIHLANDFLYGIAKGRCAGLKVSALSDNSAIITCLANDVGYEHIFSEQLNVQADKGDLLVVLSGSGNSPNIIRALECAKIKGIKSYAMLGFDGGKCKNLANTVIHFEISDMQIAEDLQLISGHMLMQWLYKNYSE